jgi:hypothetical protein
MDPSKSQCQTQPHPNEFDHKRIERALMARERYRYVSPHVLLVANGYRIESPCCSRNIDPQGGVIDVAWIEYQTETKAWRLYNKNHVAGCWEVESIHDRLNDALKKLTVDPERKFWQ